MSAEDLAARATSFGGVASTYDRYRPAPPPQLGELLEPIEGRLAVDLAAGTGLCSRFLASLGAAVVAVELDPRMAALVRPHGVLDGHLEVVLGRAEAIPLRRGSADLVTVSSAWHWFDRERAVAEIARVLAPRGRLFVLRNSVDYAADASWVAEVRRLRAALPRGPAPHTHEVRLGRDVGLVVTREAAIEWSWSRTVDELVALLGTYSGALMGDRASVEHLSAQVRAIAAPHVVDGRVELPMVCTIVEASRE